MSDETTTQAAEPEAPEATEPEASTPPADDLASRVAALEKRLADAFGGKV